MGKFECLDKMICQCGCGEEIEIKYFHKWNSHIKPKYKRGHNLRINNPSKKGKIPWNKGLTKENSEIIRISSEKVSEKTKGKKKGPLTEKHIKNLSLSHKGKQAGKSNPMYGKPSPVGSGWGKGSYYMSPFQGKIYLRSSWEKCYAEYLDSKNIKWYYEFQRFPLYNTTYAPDFFLPEENLFVEIKGYMYPEQLKKINEFKEKYPEKNIIILFELDLKKLGVKIKC